MISRLSRMVSPKKPSQHLLIPQHVLPPPPSKSFRGLQHVFPCFDENGDGKISPVELHNCMKATVTELSFEEAEEVVRLSDSDRDGLLSMEEFAQLGGEQDEKGESLREAFRVYEMEGRGCITPKSLKRALEKLGVSSTINDCREMIRMFDVNGDGVISFEEFSIMVTHMDTRDRCI